MAAAHRTASKKKTPSLRRHKATGQAYVVLNRRAIYLGRQDDPATERKYHQLVAEWIASGRQLKPRPHQTTVTEVAARFWQHARQYYRKPDGTPTSELRTFGQIVKLVRRLYGSAKATAFGPLALEAVREELVRSGLTRQTVNGYVGRIKHVFK